MPLYMMDIFAPMGLCFTFWCEIGTGTLHSFKYNKAVSIRMLFIHWMLGLKNNEQPCNTMHPVDNDILARHCIQFMICIHNHDTVMSCKVAQESSYKKTVWTIDRRNPSVKVSSYSLAFRRRVDTSTNGWRPRAMQVPGTLKWTWDCLWYEYSPTNGTKDNANTNSTHITEWNIFSRCVMSRFGLSMCTFKKVVNVDSICIIYFKSLNSLFHKSINFV